jgi:hypothetical protein
LAALGYITLPGKTGDGELRTWARSRDSKENVGK